MPETTAKQKIKKLYSRAEYSTSSIGKTLVWLIPSRGFVNSQRVDTFADWKIPFIREIFKCFHKDQNVDKNIENLKQIYDFDLEQKEEIENFLRQNKEIIQVLQDAQGRIKQYFQDEHLYLEYEDGEEYEDGGELSLSIETQKNVDEALEKLSDFENNWWTDKWIQINSKLSIDVRFIK